MLPNVIPILKNKFDGTLFSLGFSLTITASSGNVTVLEKFLGLIVALGINIVPFTSKFGFCQDIFKFGVAYTLYSGKSTTFALSPDILRLIKPFSFFKSILLLKVRPPLLKLILPVILAESNESNFAFI